MSKEHVKDEVDKVADLPITLNSEGLQGTESLFTAAGPINALGKGYGSSLIRQVKPQNRERILEDLLTVRILVQTWEQGLGWFIKLHSSDGSSTEGQGYLHRDHVWNRNKAQYHLALVKHENNPTRKPVFKLEFEANPTFCQEHAIVTLFPNTPEPLWFKLNCIESYLNEESCIMSCENVPFAVFEKYDNMFNELANLRKESLKEEMTTKART